MLKYNTLIICILVLSSLAAAQSTKQVNVGYIYPAGAQQGNTITAIVGGQYLRGTTRVLVSGDGVTAEADLFGKPVRSINGEKRQLLMQKFNDLRREKIAEFTGEEPKIEKVNKRFQAVLDKMKKELSKPDLTEKEREKIEEYYSIPDHPYLEGMDDMSLRELENLRAMVMFPRDKTQDNRQISEFMQLKIHVAKDAQPGPREIRLVTPNSVSDPIVFLVDTVPEVRELEPNNRQAIPDKVGSSKLPPMKVIQLPVVLNGQIMPGDVDRFRFRAKKGQKLVIETHARSLIPYLADAVPGWFQATVALYDAKGQEVAYTDDFMFNPDPVLMYEVDQTGDYELEIHDSIYRGREDFVYRVKIGEQPFITSIFPLGGMKGKSVKVEVQGWNLPVEEVALNTSSDDNVISEVCCVVDGQYSNAALYTVSDIPELIEKEANNSIEKAESVIFPVVVNGRIDGSGDVDIFKFNGKAGEKVSLEVMGRVLNSPIDSFIKLTDSVGKVIAVNDDYREVDKHLYLDTSGLTTHHADSFLMADLPADDTYYVHISDVQNKGGINYGYRLKLAAAEPDFRLRTSISSASVNAGNYIPFTIFAMRKDGFAGEIHIQLKDPPPGFELAGGVIPAGCDKVSVTMTTPGNSPTRIFFPELVGWAKIEDQIVVRTVVPADDTMQAFLYRHLVPADDFVVQVVKKKWPFPPVEILDTPIELAPGETRQVVAKTAKRSYLNEIKLQLRDNPEGIEISDVKVVKQGLAFNISADADEMKDGFNGNLLVESIREYYPKDKDGKQSKTMKSYSMGYLPAIPVRVR